MSTTFATLAADAEKMRQLFSDVFTAEKYSAAKLVELKQAVAKDHLKRDSYRIFRIDPSESTDLANFDEIVGKYSDSFGRALAYLQCYYYFSDKNDVEGLNAARMRQCSAWYDTELAEFGSYFTGNTATVAMAAVSRG